MRHGRIQMEVSFVPFVDLQRLLQNDAIEVKQVIHVSRGGFYVFYEQKSDLVQREIQRIRELVEIAKEVSMDEGYASLKNKRQREIYLSQFHLLRKRDAEDVIELLKPEMAALFKEEEELPLTIEEEQ